MWLILALVSIRATTISRANIRTFADFRGRLKRLDELTGYEVDLDRAMREAGSGADTGQVERALREVMAYREFIKCEMLRQDIRWVRAHGYNNLWVALHSAEEASLEFVPAAEAVREGLADEARLFESEIPNASPKLLNRLRIALRALDPSVDQYFFDPAPRAEGEPDSLPARGMLREIRATINQFNDARYDGLAKTRNNLLDLVPFGGLAIYFILALAVLEVVAVRHIEAAAVFYIAGVLAGLLATWYSQIKAHSTIETFGLAGARVLHALVFSGAAAIAGVVLYQILSESLGVDLTPGEANGAREILSLSDIFDLEENLFGVFVALLFGVAPEFLLTVLNLYGDRYIQEVKSTSPAGTD